MEENEHVPTRGLFEQLERISQVACEDQHIPLESIMTPILSDIDQQEAQVWTVVVARGTGLAHFEVSIETDREAKGTETPALPDWTKGCVDREPFQQGFLPKEWGRNRHPLYLSGVLD